MEDYERILEFWFEGVEKGEAVSLDSETHQWWFKRTQGMTESIAEGFSDDVKHASCDDYKSWGMNARGSLALVLILDQFSRCVHAGKSSAFDNDLKALEQVFACIKRKRDEELTLLERAFLYLPLMHAETEEIQEMSLQMYNRLVKLAEEDADINIEYFKYFRDLALKHYDIIKEFQRFPQRNKLIKRKATSTEINYVLNSFELLET